MIKKISLFFSAIAIGILSIFGSISTKNTAEPQYFLENTKIKNASKVENINNETVIDFYLNNETIYNYTEDLSYEILKTNVQGQDYPMELEFFNNNDSLGTIREVINDVNSLYFTVQEQYCGFLMSDYGEYFVYKQNEINYNWLGNDNDITGFRIKYTTNDPIIVYENLGVLNQFIGNNTSFDGSEEQEPTEPIPPLEQINTLVNDIVNWFTNIFNGLGNVFYDPTANKLTAWGTVMFIGVAIMLISMALKWVISLIRGV